MRRLRLALPALKRRLRLTKARAHCDYFVPKWGECQGSGGRVASGRIHGSVDLLSFPVDPVHHGRVREALMGWKAVKEHYRIGHIVHVQEGRLHIGSPYISDLIVVAPDGVVTKAWESRSGDLNRYIQEIAADRALFARIFARQDSFTASIPVFTFEDGRIIEHACEEPGWPNATHDGTLMYENTFFTDRRKAVDMARKDAASGIRSYERSVADLQEQLARAREELEASKAALARLDGEQGTKAA